ncbi:uncharacterized protein LOC121752457 isoform X2 [Salvia splendens]|uniref:uncharacterized protein LOC121752457 isoform X2 n=1 Tax=Salvia splendens TaxID=180675 RepID=UPI001C272043|nr:uncharacterized protein LOC121752457 isoform X2 [Salvia splendens]
MNSQKQNQDSMLRESIKHFLTSYHTGSSDFSSFESIFFRLIQTMLDPPLEITWFYAAVTFHTAKRNSPSSRVLIAKDLLRLFIRCSNLSSASKKIALLAPVVYDLYSIVCDTRAIEPHERIEVGKLVENLVSHVMVSAGVYNYGSEDAECDNAVVCFEDLVCVWTTDRGGGSCNFGETLRMFFPLLSDGTWKRMNAGCGMRELVGIVLLEVFFLRLYMSFSSGVCREDILKNTRDQAVQTIKGFRNIYFLVLNLMDYQSRGTARDDLLKRSIHNFLVECPKMVSNLSGLVSLYRGLIEKLKDPPLDIVLFYGAVVFHAYKSSSLPPPGILLVAEDLLELVNESSSLFTALRKVAVIAPIAYLLYHLELNFSARDPSLREEIGITVEGMVNYISICCSQYTEEGGQESEYLGGYIMDLVRVWMVDPARDCDKINSWEFFFPTLDNDSQPEVAVYLGYLAGVVMNETLLLRLLLKISPAIDREDLQKNMLNVAIQTIKGFQNFYFLDMLLKMLSGPTLPIVASMSNVDGVLLHKVLYDAVILVDYSFHSGRWVQSSVSQLKKLALAWVLAADRAIEFARAAGDQPRAISYLNAFKECQLVAELIKWVCNQARIFYFNTIPDVTNPRALIQWLLVLNAQGIDIFDHSMAKLYAKAVESGPPELTLRTGNLNVPIIDLHTSGESEDREMGNEPDNGALGGLCLASAKKGSGRKRKEALSGSRKQQVKQVKLDHLGSAVRNNFLSLSGGGGPDSGGVLVENIASDDDMDLAG